MGKLGQAVARRAYGFNMEVAYYQPEKISEEKELIFKAKYTSLVQLLKESDFITICTPLTSATYHLISEAELQIMKPSCLIINTSRGSIVDEAAIGQALEKKSSPGTRLMYFRWKKFSLSKMLHTSIKA